MQLAMQDAPVEAADEQRAGMRFLLVLAIYFLLQVVLRVTSPAVLDLDEAEAILSFQHLQAGYGNQPPLYFWLQWLMFSAFGINLVALSVQKNLLLFCTYLAMFHTARLLIGMNAAIIAAASLILLPQLGWESQRDLTHSVLATCMAALTLWCYVGLLRHRSRWRHALFGLLVGLGLQSKYNFAVFALGLLAASLLVREHRRAVWTRDAWLALAVAALSLAPHALWLFNHLDVATGATLEKMHGRGGDYAGRVARGFGNMVGATMLFATPLWIVYGWIWWRRRGQARARLDTPAALFILWFYLAAFACITVLVLSGELARIKSRWMQPILFLLPLAFLVLFPSLARRTMRRIILWAAGVCAILILAGMLARGYLDKDTRAPFGALSAQLMLRFPQADTVVADDLTVAGNLYLHHPAWTVMLLPKVLQSRPALRGELLLIGPGGQPEHGVDRFLDAYPSGVVRRRGRLAIGTPQDRQGAIAVEYALVSLKDA
ncbi:glycosyltransferase family 39 protein [Massilia sp.]|uniref:glycosyltransferase family 39 protein n=1 Tax=Massilia sp. TaxID=1882437 RepID=UPI0028AD30CC|nr:glycosyltransferase family 39 protein [Massilia sp.]